MLASPLTRRVPTPLAELSAGFLEGFGKPAGLWLPCDDPEGKARDFSANSNTGALNGGVTVVPGGFGVLGQGWNFATGKNISTVAAPAITTNAVSAGCLFSPGVLTRGDLVTKWQNGSSSGDQFDLLYGVTSGKPAFYVSFGSGAVGGEVGATTMVVGSWYFAVGTFDGSTVKIYLNGNLEASGSHPGTLSSGNRAYELGNNGAGNGQLTGQIAMAFVIPVALSAAQVSSLYNALLAGEPYPIFAPSVNERWWGNVTAGGAFAQSIAGNLSFTGTLSRGVSARQLGTLSFAGAVGRQIAVSRTATLSFLGSTKQGIGKGLSAVLSFAGTIKEGISHAFAGTLSFTGGISKGISKGLSAAVSFSGTIKRGIGKSLSAGLSFTGGMSRAITYKLASVLSFAASLGNGHSQSVNLTAVLSFAGNVNRGISKSLSASVGFAGSIGKGISKGLLAGLSFVGGIGKGIAKGISATLSFTGRLTTGAGKLLMLLRRWFNDE